MNPLETVDLIWSLGDFLAEFDQLTLCGLNGSDGRPGGHTFLIDDVGGAPLLLERLILFCAVLETVASARGFAAKTFNCRPTVGLRAHRRPAAWLGLLMLAQRATLPRMCPVLHGFFVVGEPRLSPDRTTTSYTVTDAPARDRESGPHSF